MPCSDIRDDWDKQHQAEGAALLCDILTKVPNTLALIYRSAELDRWWAEHQNRDLLYARKTKDITR